MLNKFKKFISNLFSDEVKEVVREDIEDYGYIYTYEQLIEKSVSENVPILVGNQHTFNELKARNPKVEVYGFAPNFTLHVKNRDFPNGVLVDSSVQRNLLKELSDREIEIRN